MVSAMDVFPKYPLIISFITVKTTNECKQDPIKLTILCCMYRHFVLHVPAFCVYLLFFCKYWPDGELLRLKLVASNSITLK
jgi:hypothetical protein